MGDCCYICVSGIPTRLVGGGANYGRVEVYSSNQWGTVCDDYFDLNDAKVVCRSILGDDWNGIANALQGAVYGQGVGAILMDDVDCDGEEFNLDQCSYESTHNCQHKEDASVMCNRGRSEID